MAAFCYFTGPMDCGKSALALQLDFTQAAAGRRGRRRVIRAVARATLSDPLPLGEESADDEL